MRKWENATFINKEWKEIFRQPVACYTRVMWYLRSRLIPTQSIRWWDLVNDKNKDIEPFTYWFNVGKRSEFASRVAFKEWHTCPRNFDKINSMKQDNRSFIEKYN